MNNLIINDLSTTTSFFLKKISFFSKIFNNKLKSIYIDDNHVILDLDYKDLYTFCFFFKNFSFFSFDSLINIFCCNTMTVNRYFIYYNLISTKYNYRIFLRTKVPSNMIVYSLTHFYSSSNWLEREVWDFFGIFFYKHGDLRRILTDYGFDGFPLRKNFPVTGFFEVMYDVDIKSVIYTFLETTQEIRIYQFESPWENSFFYNL